MRRAKPTKIQSNQKMATLIRVLLLPTLKHIFIKSAVVAETLAWPTPGSASMAITDPNGPGLTETGQHVKPSPFLGWRFGPDRGPKLKFVIQARDEYGVPRDYNVSVC